MNTLNSSYKASQEECDEHLEREIEDFQMKECKKTVELMRSYVNEVEKDLRAHDTRFKLINSDFTRKNWELKHKALSGVLAENKADLTKEIDKFPELFI